MEEDYITTVKTYVELEVEVRSDVSDSGARNVSERLVEDIVSPIIEDVDGIEYQDVEADEVIR